MRIGRLIRYAGIAAISGTIGFLIGGGRLPDNLRQIATQAPATANELQRDMTADSFIEVVREAAWA